MMGGSVSSEDQIGVNILSVFKLQTVEKSTFFKFFLTPSLIQSKEFSLTFSLNLHFQLHLFTNISVQNVIQRDQNIVR